MASVQYCGRCGAERSLEGDQFCRGCGAPLSAGSHATPAVPKLPHQQSVTPARSIAEVTQPRNTGDVLWGLLIGALSGFLGIGVLLLALPRERRRDKLFGAWFGMIGTGLVLAILLGVTAALSADSNEDRGAQRDPFNSRITDETGNGGGTVPGIVNATPYRQRTAVPRDSGCGIGASISIEQPSVVGRTLRTGDALRVTIAYVAPECTSGGVTVYGRKWDGDSDSYEYISLNTGTTGDVPLPAVSGTLTLAPIPDAASDIDGFEACMIWVNLNDGVFGGFDFQHYEGSYYCGESAAGSAEFYPGGPPGAGGGERYFSP